MLRHKLLFLCSRVQRREPAPRQAQSVVLRQISRALGAQQSSPGSESQAGAGVEFKQGDPLQDVLFWTRPKNFTKNWFPRKTLMIFTSFSFVFVVEKC